MSKCNFNWTFVYKPWHTLSLYYDFFCLSLAPRSDSKVPDVAPKRLWTTAERRGGVGRGWGSVGVYRKYPTVSTVTLTFHPDQVPWHLPQFTLLLFFGRGKWREHTRAHAVTRAHAITHTQSHATVVRHQCSKRRSNTHIMTARPLFCQFVSNISAILPAAQPKPHPSTHTHTHLPGKYIMGCKLICLRYPTKTEEWGWGAEMLSCPVQTHVHMTHTHNDV